MTTPNQPGSSTPGSNNPEPSRPRFPYDNRLNTPAVGLSPSSADDVNRLHDYDDKDMGSDAHHHTLGNGATQAAAGNHLHPDYAEDVHLHPEYSGTAHAHPEYSLDPHTHNQYSETAHTHPAPNLEPYPKGFFAERPTATAVALPGNTSVNLTDTQITIGPLPTARSFRASVGVRFRAAASVYGLYAPRIFVNGVVIGLYEQGSTSVAGGTGEVGFSSSHTFSVPANTSILVSAGAIRLSGGSTTDTVVAAICSIDDIGPG